MVDYPVRMPAIFWGHGSPGNVMEDNQYTRRWSEMGREIGKPRAIICISAHWYTRGIRVTAMDNPKTIHDFNGFPQAMYEMRYPAPGDAKLAREVQAKLAPLDVTLDDSWGLDHGTWAILKIAYPDADVPVIQISMDATQPPKFHYEVGKKLAAFRDEGVLIVGSGNIVHNLGIMDWRLPPGGYDWAQRYADYIRNAIEADKPENVIGYLSPGEDAQLSVPSPDHFLPLLYVLGARLPGDTPRFETSTIEFGSLDMTTVVLDAE